ncbi:MAG: hypothetical protein WA960_03620 [Tunicatimonas sp.]
MRWILCALGVGIAMSAYAQNSGEIALQLPRQPGWNEVREGETLEFSLSAAGGSGDEYSFQLTGDSLSKMQLDPAGDFSWQPNYDVVGPDEPQKTVTVRFAVRSSTGQTATQSADLVVYNQARISALPNLPPFFVKQQTDNRYQLALPPDFAVPAGPHTLPEGMRASPGGELTWNPTDEQFEALQEAPLPIRVATQDQTYGDVLIASVDVLPAAPAKEEAPRASDPDNAVRLQFPRRSGWNVVREDEALNIKLSATGGLDQRYSYRVLNGEAVGLSYDTLGNVYWKPSYDVVDRLEESKKIPLIFEVHNRSGQRDRQQLSLRVDHTNRPPEIGDLKKFYVQYGTDNTYQLGSEDAITDPDDDPIVFKPLINQMPQGMTLSAQGELSWKPSLMQYSRLRREPIELEFVVEDQPYEAQQTGKLRIEATQQDLPPNISVVPNQDHFYIREDESLNLKFYLSDPNGDEDIVGFDFVSDQRIPRSALLRNEPTQWEFVWQPGYDFFVEPGDTGTYQITFFVMDRANQRQERRITVTVQDAENLVEKDQLLYRQYRTGLMRIWDLMTQLKEKEKELSRSYRRARRGKKHRVLTTASIGAVTGLSPVVLSNDVTGQRYVSGVGGTASMTLGSLEAGKVIGKDPSSIYEKLSYINQKLNELQTQGNVFAGKYALSASRRSAEFSEDLKKLILLLKIEKVTELELDASWKNPKKASDKNIQDTFRDFNPDPDQSTQINE